MPGIFISFEGGEGVGKSTQILLLAWRLEAAGYEVLLLREPGGTSIGESIRDILLDPKNHGMDSHAELLLYEAARAQLVNQVIEPALASGKVVLCDRYMDSTYAYQGFARGLDLSVVQQANQLGCRGLMPQRTILLTHDSVEALDRATANGADRLEAEGLEFHQKVLAGFEFLAQNEPQRVRKVASAAQKTDTAATVFEQLKDLFPRAAQAEFAIDEQMLAKVKREHD